MTKKISDSSKQNSKFIPTLSDLIVIPSGTAHTYLEILFMDISQLCYWFLPTIHKPGNCQMYS